MSALPPLLVGRASTTVRSVQHTSCCVNLLVKSVPPCEKGGRPVKSQQRVGCVLTQQVWCVWIVYCSLSTPDSRPDSDSQRQCCYAALCTQHYRTAILDYHCQLSVRHWLLAAVCTLLPPTLCVECTILSMLSSLAHFSFAMLLSLLLLTTPSRRLPSCTRTRPTYPRKSDSTVSATGASQAAHYAAEECCPRR